MSERCEYIRTSGTTYWCSLAAEPRQWVGLTDEEIAGEFYKFEAAGAWYQFARAIEAKLKEKNK